MKTIYTMSGCKHKIKQKPIKAKGTIDLYQCNQCDNYSFSYK